MDPGLNDYQGMAPAVGLVDPKFPHNVGAAVRAASCYGIGQVWFTGNRVPLDASRRYRLPREERMRGYKDVVRARMTAFSTRSATPSRLR
jgi:tRNA(Leu) C34 or U34 (ribose-2'-O)-methylase TrmL